MEIVLGVSMTPTTVRMALVEGEKADGVILEHDVFDITAIDDSATSSAAEQVIAAILGTREGAIAGGHHLVATGVSWSDSAEADMLGDALTARDIDGVALVPDLQAAAALAQTVGRAVGHDSTALMFVDHDSGSLAVVEAADGVISQVVTRSVHQPDALSTLAELASTVDSENVTPQGMVVVGSGVDVASVKSHLQDVLSMPVIAPQEPQLALARGAALAAAKAPRNDNSTIGWAYAQDPDVLALLGPEEADTRSPKRFAVAGSALSAVFCVGMVALAAAMAVSIEPTAEQRPTASPSQVTSQPPPPPRVSKAHQVAPPAPPPPQAAPPVAARLMIPPAPPPPRRVLTQAAAPAPAAPAAPVAPAAPPPAAPVPPPAPVIQLPLPGLGPFVIGPRYLPPRAELPWSPAPRGKHGGGHGGGHRGRHGGD